MLDQLRINKSDIHVQHRQPSVWSVYFNFSRLPKMKFSRGYWGVNNSLGNSRGVGEGVIFEIRKWKFQGGGGLMWNSLCGGGVDIFWNYMYTLWIRQNRSSSNFSSAFYLQQWKKALNENAHMNTHCYKDYVLSSFSPFIFWTGERPSQLPREWMTVMRNCVTSVPELHYRRVCH